MRNVLLTCALALALAACGSERLTPAQPVPASPAPAPVPTPTPAPLAEGQCATDADCVWSAAAICPECCHCASIMTVAEDRLVHDRAAGARCAAPDCAHVRCEPCANRPARIVCEAGACVGRSDGAATPPPSGPAAATS